MRLFILAAAVLFGIAIVVLAFNVTLVISGLAWIACGLFAWVLDLLFGGYVVPIARNTQPAAQPTAGQQ